MTQAQALTELIQFMQADEYPTIEVEGYIRKAKQLLKKVTAEPQGKKIILYKKPAAKKTTNKK
jgi:hypothetical protein